MDKLKTSTTTFMSSLKEGLAKTRASFVTKVKRVFTFWKKIDEGFWEELEEVMLTSDIGIGTTQKIIEQMRSYAKKEHILEPAKLIEYLKAYLSEIMSKQDSSLVRAKTGPTVILVIGVNGTGKTTSLAKLAGKLKKQNNKVLLAAADTFRAAAIDQLQVWANRLEIDLIKSKEGGDPAAICFDATSAAKARGVDYLIIDTAGRLHSKSNLMEELRKMRRVIEREIPGAPHETLIVLDSTTGQNALIQARTFSEISPLTGIILTKLDGSAKGGIVISICDELNIPVKYIGFGEKEADFGEFDSEAYMNSLFDNE